MHEPFRRLIPQPLWVRACAASITTNAPPLCLHLPQLPHRRRRHRHHQSHPALPHHPHHRDGTLAMARSAAFAWWQFPSTNAPSFLRRWPRWRRFPLATQIWNRRPDASAMANANATETSTIAETTTFTFRPTFSPPAPCIQVRVLNIFRYAAPKVGKGPERRAEIAKSRANIPAAKWGIRARTFG